MERGRPLDTLCGGVHDRHGQQASKERLRALFALRSCGGAKRLRASRPESNDGACFGQQAKTASLCPDLSERRRTESRGR